MIAAILQAVGLVFVIEGLLYALVPGHLRSMMEAMKALPEDRLRIVGAVAMALGVGIVWAAKALAGS
jgi:uncharacterized protein